MVGEKEVTSPLCNAGKNCFYLGGASVFQVLAERDYLRTRVDKMEAACIQFASAFESKDKENASLKEEIRVLKTERTQERETIYKPAKKEKKRTGKPGAPVGHPGKTREKPKEPNRIVDVHLKRSHLGPNAILISNLLHNHINIPYGKIEEIYNIFGLSLTSGTLIGMDKRVAEKGIPFYTQLEERIRNSSVSYLDETSLAG